MTNTSTRALHFLIALAVVALDRWSKLAVVHALPLYAVRPVIPSFFKLTHTENPGAAWVKALKVAVAVPSVSVAMLCVSNVPEDSSRIEMY